MNRTRWFRVGPTETEAYHGPLLARMRPQNDDSLWFDMAVFRGGVWAHTMHASRATLKKSFMEECERYELECDRARLDWLDAQRNGKELFHVGSPGMYLVCLSPTSGGAETLREALDAAIEAERKRLSEKGTD